MSQKCFLGMHTVFVARENIAYLKEWIVYHALLGVEHFYLYDNTGSIGRQGSNSTTNKYGINFHELTKDMTDADVANELAGIIADVPVDVTLIPWQPKDRYRRIYYGYNESVRHCIREYCDCTVWMAFMDVDEFLFSPARIDIPRQLRDLGGAGFNRLIILQKKFLDRFLSPSKYAVDIYDCIDGIDTSAWAPKNIIHVNHLKLHAITDMHQMPVYGMALPTDTDTLRFNHYNVNPVCLKWMKRFYRSTDEFSINAQDDGMKRYQQRVHDQCKL